MLTQREHQVCAGLVPLALLLSVLSGWLSVSLVSSSAIPAASTPELTAAHSCMIRMLLQANISYEVAVLYEAILANAPVSPEEFVAASRPALRRAGLPRGTALRSIVNSHRLCVGAQCGDTVRASCSDGGECSLDSTSMSYVCLCEAGHSGHSCESHVCDHTAAASACQNSGICHHAFEQSGFRCECPPGFYGERCENVDVCASNPCQNAGTCINTADSSGGFQCHCRSRFTGKYCGQEWRKAFLRKMSNNNEHVRAAVSESQRSITNVMYGLLTEIRSMLSFILSRGEPTTASLGSLPAVAGAYGTSDA